MSDRLLIFTGPSARGWHRIGQFLECPTKYARKYEGGEGGGGHSSPEKEESVPLTRGSIIHLGLAQHYSRMREVQQGRDPDLYYTPSEAIEIVCAAKGEAWLREKDDCLGCLDAYFDNYRNEEFKVLRVEELMEGTFHGHRLTGRLDLVIEDRQGRIFVVDHKSTAFASPKQRTFYSVSGQMHAYRWLASGVYGERLAGMRINLVQHTKPYKFQRFDLDPAPHMFSNFPRIIKEAEETISRYKAEGRAPEEWPMAISELTCFHRYGACEYLEKCKWGR
jgi:hypothetical protein